MQKMLKEITRDELFAEFEEEPYEQRKRRKDGAPMFDRWGVPIMVRGSGPKEVPADTRKMLDGLIARADVDGLILYVNIQMDSSSFGRKQAMVYGPGCTFKTPDDAPGWLNDLPSQRQYTQAIFRKPKE
jgi:hypothetical protein